MSALCRLTPKPGALAADAGEIEGMRWLEDVTMGELRTFARDLVQLNDVTRTFLVYDRIADRWRTFDYGDWILRMPGGYVVWTDESVAAEWTVTLVDDEPDAGPKLDVMAQVRAVLVKAIGEDRTEAYFRHHEYMDAIEKGLPLAGVCICGDVFARHRFMSAGQSDFPHRCLGCGCLAYKDRAMAGPDDVVREIKNGEPVSIPVPDVDPARVQLVTMERELRDLPEGDRWVLHNLLAHPALAVAPALGAWLHEQTAPPPDDPPDRGEPDDSIPVGEVQGYASP